MKAEDFELKYSEISAKIEQNAMRLIELKEAEERRTLIKERVTEFRRLLQKNEILTKFDRTIFESIVENVICNGIAVTPVFGGSNRNCIFIPLPKQLNYLFVFQSIASFLKVLRL